MSIRIPQLSLKGEPPVSASGAGAAGLRWGGRELPQTQSDWFISQQIFSWHILAAATIAG